MSLEDETRNWSSSVRAREFTSSLWPERMADIDRDFKSNIRIRLSSDPRIMDLPDFVQAKVRVFLIAI